MGERLGPRVGQEDAVLTPSVSLILPTFGDGDLLDLYFWSLARTSRADHQVVVVCHSAFPAVDIRGLDVRVLRTIDGDVGVGRAQNRAIDASDREYVAISNDDIVFMPGWDDISGRAAPDRWLGWELLEPRPGSFPPPCEAGTNPASFQWEIASSEAERRTKPSSQPCGDGGLFLFHRSLWDGSVRYREDMGDFGGQDTDFMWRVFQGRPELMYGRLNTCLYHFGGVAIGRRPGHRSPGDAFWSRFVSDHGIDPHEAYRRIQQQTAEAVEREPWRWPS